MAIFPITTGRLIPMQPVNIIGNSAITADQRTHRRTGNAPRNFAHQDKSTSDPSC